MMIHGGAGELDHIRKKKDAAPYLESIRAILERGMEILKRGGLALDAVETCAALLEDDPLFNAGRGSVLNELGKVEMDAAIMDGRDLNAGAVACIAEIANPVKLARLVLSEGKHVMLAGEGALRFAAQHSVEILPDSYFVTEYRRKQFEKARAKHEKSDLQHGTIGAVARDKEGNLAAAASTGGLVYKKPGRVGDTPIIGAGIYADNNTCAVSATGHGEGFMRTVLAKHISDLVEFKNRDAESAAQEGIEYLVNRVNGRGGVIVIDRDGRCSARSNTRTMVHGWCEHGGNAQCTFK